MTAWVNYIGSFILNFAAECGYESKRALAIKDKRPQPNFRSLINLAENYLKTKTQTASEDHHFISLPAEQHNQKKFSLEKPIIVSQVKASFFNTSVKEHKKTVNDKDSSPFPNNS